ncbi:flagellar assembly protein FliX [Lichenicoccus sp.]|uniref:flagellar assembly protein FliX n=1 Tax=Lichenicoccus sp. TaxID=2781899 RepID=UPI003D0E769B
MTIIAASAVTPPSEPSGSSRRSDATGPDFRVSLESGLATQAASFSRGGGSQPVSASGMLALQEATGRGLAHDDRDAADREARRHGQDILAALADLQRDLLTAGSLQGRLDRLAALLDDPSSARDPDLARVLHAIRLRAQLEVLRLSRDASVTAL